MSFQVTSTEIAGVRLLTPKFFEDDRGRFRRTFCAQTLADAGVDFQVKQSNLSENRHAYTLRGFHWQDSDETKLLSCVTGEIHDIVVDLRPASPTMGKFLSFRLSGKNGLGLIVPPGCANAWMTLQPNTAIQYWHTDIYRPAVEHGLRYDDPAFAFPWPAEPQVISAKDRSYPDYNSILA